MEKKSESDRKVGDLDSYEIEGGETKSEILQNLTEFQFSCVSLVPSVKGYLFLPKLDIFMPPSSLNHPDFGPTKKRDEKCLLTCG